MLTNQDQKQKQNQTQTISEYVSGIYDDHMKNVKNIPNLKNGNPFPLTPIMFIGKYFFAKKKNFEQIYNSINSVLENLEETKKNNIDYCYDEDQVQWQVKYLNGSDYNEITIKVYWNIDNIDFIVEIFRWKGDCIIFSINNLYKKLLHYINGCDNVSSSIKPKQKKSRLMSSEYNQIPDDIDISAEHYKNCSINILKNADNKFRESRLFVSKFLCNMVKNDLIFLSSPDPDLKKRIVEVLNSLIEGEDSGVKKDEFPEIQEFAIYAFSLFAEIDSFKSDLAKIKNLYIIVDIVLYSTFKYPYKIANIRRRSCIALKELIPYNKELIRGLFEIKGISSSAILDTHCSGIAQEFVDYLKIMFI